MPYTHPLDRLVVKLRPALIVLAALCFPAFLITYGLMLKAAFQSWPSWGVAVMVVSHLLGWLGLSALLDSRQERMSRTEAERS